MTVSVPDDKPRLSVQAYRCQVEGAIQKRLVSRDHARARGSKANRNKLSRAGKDKGELPDFTSGS